MPTGHDTRVPWAWLTALTLLGLGLRLIALNQQLWFDEIDTLLHSVRQPLTTILTTYISQNQHTLYSVLAHGSIALLGDSSWALRLPAVLFGVASIPALYLCARQMTNRQEALLASALLTVSYHHVWFSQNARGYTGMLFWTLLGTYFFIRGARTGDLRPWAAYGFVMALGTYTHLTMGFVAVGHGLVYLWLLASRAQHLGHRPRSLLAPMAGFALAGLLALLLNAPALPQIFVHTAGEADSAIQSEWTSLIWLAFETLRGLSASLGGHLWAVAVGGFILAAGLVSYWRADRYLVGLIALPMMVTAGLMIAFLQPQFFPRFFFFAIGFGMMLLVRGALLGGEFAARILRRRPQEGVLYGTVMVTLMLVGSAVSLPAAYRYPKQDFVGAMQFVEDQRNSDEPVVLTGLARMPYQHFYGRDWPAIETHAELDAVRSQGRPVWLLYTLPIHVQSRFPEVWEVIQTEFETVRIFPGTLGGGELYVCRSQSAATTEETSYAR